MSQTTEPTAEQLINMLRSMSVNDLQQLRANLDLFKQVIDLVLGKAEETK